MDQLPRLGKRELICLLLFTCNYVVFVWRGFLFLWVLGMGNVILLWHSLSLPYNYLTKNRKFLEFSKKSVLDFKDTAVRLCVHFYCAVHPREETNEKIREGSNQSQLQFKGVVVFLYLCKNNLQTTLKKLSCL